MLQKFAEDWQLFGDGWTCGMLVAAVLALAGVVVVARGQVFVGLALAQASTLGLALGLFVTAFCPHEVAHVLEHRLIQSALAVAFAASAAMLLGRPGRPAFAHREAMLCWLFLFANSAALLLVSHSPRSHDEITSLVASSLLSATREDVMLFAVLLATVAACWWRGRDAILLYAIDPPMATALGVPRAFGTVLWCVIGLCIGLAIRVSGVLFTTGFLVLPALAAAQWCASARSVLWLAPAIAVLCGGLGLVLSHQLDDPPAPSAVAVLSFVTLVSYARCRRR